MYKNLTMDRRVMKSKHALKEALISLMQRQDFHEITITDIVQLADLNRGTFYKHYQYKEEILEEMIEEVMTDLKMSYREPYQGSTTFDVKDLTSSAIKIFEHVEKYRSFYTLIVQVPALSGFQNTICTILKELTLQDLYDSEPTIKVDRELQASFHAYALVGMIIEWIHQDFKYSSTYMAEQLLGIIQQSQGHTVYKLHPSEIIDKKMNS